MSNGDQVDGERPGALSATRGGLNGSEAAMAWAFARFGGDIDACSVLEGDAAKAVRAVAERVIETGEPEEGKPEGSKSEKGGFETGGFEKGKSTAGRHERLKLAEIWRREDRRWDSLEQVVSHLDPGDVEAYAQHLSPRWHNALCRIVGIPGGHAYESRPCPWHDNSVRTRRAIVWLALGALREEAIIERAELEAHSGFDLEQLVGMTSLERERWIRQLGIFQLAELARDQDRRSLVRLRRALLGEDRPWFDTCIKYEREIDRLERGRMRELFLSISRQEPDLTVRLLHLGLYSIAASAGVRFAQKLASVARRLPSALETLLSYYHRLDRRDAPAPLAPAVRRSLNDYVHRRAQTMEAIDE